MKRFLTALIICCSATIGYAQQILAPGTGWNGPLSEPSAVGSSGDPGYDATAIARWDVVPRQTFDSTFEIGIIAFHINGIDRVEISVEGGAWTTINDMTLNPRTDVWEYWAMLNADRFDAGQEGSIEVRAIVYPKNAGQPRILADSSSTQVDQGDGSLYLVLDKGGLQHPVAWVADDGNDTTGDGTEQDPYRTIDGAIAAEWPSSVAAWSADTTGIMDGATVYLKEGSYATATAGYYDMKRWLTVTAAPGADPANVVLTTRNDGRCNIGLTRYRDLTWQPDGDQTFVSPSKSGRYIWFDHVRGIGGDRETYGSPWVNQGDTYYTGGTLYNFTEGVQTWNGTTWMVRDVHVDHIHEDAFRVNKLIVNASANDIDKGESSAHPDLIQAGGQNDRNFIIYNLKATDIKAQGIYMRGEDWAMVNIFIQQHDSASYLWQVDNIDLMKHCLVWHCGTVNQTFLWRTGDSTYNCDNISIRNCCFSSLGCGPNSDEQATDCAYLGDSAMVIDNNHFENSAFNYGTDATTGDPVYAGAAIGDYRPGSGSPLRKRSDAGLVPCDVDNNPRGDTTAVGAFAAADETPTAIGDGHMMVDKRLNLTVWPNPMGHYINIDPETPHRGVSTVNIYDRDGDVVCTMYPGAVRKSPLRWNGINQTGHPMPPGVYYVSDGHSVIRIIKTE